MEQADSRLACQRSASSFRASVHILWTFWPKVLAGTAQLAIFRSVSPR